MISDILDRYYSQYDEEGRLLTRHGHVEYITTMHYIHRYLRPGMRILEIGAGTGRYSHALAREGYRVDAVELVQHNIDQFHAATLPGENVTIVQGNACDLHAFPDGQYDLVLLLGPMYHLYTEPEKLNALSEAIRVARPGGIVFAAYCMADSSILSHCFIRGMVTDCIQKGMLDPETFITHSDPSDLFELHRKEDIEALRSHFSVTPLHLLATDGYANHMRDALATMPEEHYALYLKYHLATCERQDLIGLSHHTLDVFRKN